MRATIKDIARETHLSPSTVSLVLNNKPHRLSEETRKRVLETASQPCDQSDQNNRYCGG